ncbi:MAG: SH3 domain-containing protein [bacterium]|nr:SH3 domain-containing protein [bacterium]
MAVLRTRLSAAAVVLIVLLSAADALAQTQPIPIRIGENQTGEITRVNPAPTYTFTLEAPGVIVVQILPLSATLPAFQVADQDGIVIASAQPVNGATIQTLNAPLPAAGDYQIDVIGEIGTQYVISLQTGTILPPPTPLIVGNRVSGEVESAAPAKLYSFSADPTAILILSSASDFPESAVVIALIDADGRTLAQVNSALQGAAFRIPRGQAAYTVSLTHPGSTNPAVYSLCLETETPAARCAPYSPPPPQQASEATDEAAFNTDNPIPAGACAVESAVGVIVNVRAAPSLNADILAQLNVGERAAVTARSSDGIWWQVRLNGRENGWVSSAVTATSGQCDAIPTR